MEQTSDGGYVVAVVTQSADGDVTGQHGGADMWIVKLTAAGTIAWQRALGGSDTDLVNDVEEAADGSILAVGYTSSTDGDVSGVHGTADIWAVKLSAAGALLWQRPLGGTAAPGEMFADSYTNPYLWWPRSMVATSDGGCIIGATSYCNDGDASGNHGERDFWVVRLSATGQLVWQTMLGGSLADELFTLDEAPNDGVLVAGYTASDDGDVTGFHGGWDYWVARLSGSGTVLWTKALGGTSMERLEDVRSTADGGCVLMGLRNSTDGDLAGTTQDRSAWIVKLDANGGVEWDNVIGNYGEQWWALHPTADGGYIGACTSYSPDGFDVQGMHGSDPTNGEIWTVKLDASGQLLWQRCLGGDDVDDARDVQVTPDGGCIVAGRVNSNNGDVTGNHGSADAWVVKLGPTGVVQWQKTLGGSLSDMSGPLRVTSDGYIVATMVQSGDGNVSGTGYHGGWDPFIVKFGSDGTGVQEPETTDFLLAPSPASTNLTITAVGAAPSTPVRFFDGLGREVLRTALGNGPLTLDVSGFARGVYVVQISTGHTAGAQRLVLE